tara:strand:+ start:1023 stop:1364 length:342 start_codon:yes stop_codon:yes gene_type:complete
MNDFLDNLGANQYQKMHQPKKIKITPQTYIDMNEEFEKDDIPFRISIPTQEAIDKHRSQPSPPYHAPEPVDMVAEMWKKHKEQEQNQSDQDAEAISSYMNKYIPIDDRNSTGK